MNVCLLGKSIKIKLSTYIRATITIKGKITSKAIIKATTSKGYNKKAKRALYCTAE